MNLRTLVLAVALASGAASGAAWADSFDFDYRVEGGGGSQVVQVFDNGKQTWIQLMQPDPVPVFLSVTPAGQAVLTPRREGQFLVVDGVERVIEMVLRGLRTRITYVGRASRGIADAPVVFGHAQPNRVDVALPQTVSASAVLASRAQTLESRTVTAASSVPMSAQSMAIPFFKNKTTLGTIGRKKLRELAPFIAQSGGVTVVVPAIGTDAAAAKARYNDLLRQLLEQGVPKNKVIAWTADVSAEPDELGWQDAIFTVRTLPADTSPISTMPKTAGLATSVSPTAAAPVAELGVPAVTTSWSIKAGEDLSDVLRRWAKAAGWTESYWEAQKMFAGSDAVIPGSFEEAIEALVLALNANGEGVRIRAIFYEGNKVVRITEKKQ